MRVIIQEDYKKVSKWAAAYVARAINQFKPTPKKPFVLGLPTGSSPLGMYKELARLNKAGKVVLLPGDQVELKTAPVAGAIADDEPLRGDPILGNSRRPSHSELRWPAGKLPDDPW